MTNPINPARFAALLPTLAMSLGLGFAAAPARAADHRSFVRKHPIISGAAAAVAVHHYRRTHRPGTHHRSFVRKHPIISGAAAAATVHHYRAKHHVR